MSAQIFNLVPDDISIMMEVYDFRTIEVSFLEDGDPIDLSSWTISIVGPTWITAVLMDAAAGRIALNFKPTNKGKAEYSVRALRDPDSRVLLTGKVDCV